MSYLLVPNGVATTEAEVWIGIFDETPPASGLVLGYNGLQRPIDSSWQHWSSKNGQQAVAFQRLGLRNLEPRKRYLLTLRRGTELLADGKVTTLPAQLPRLGERPFSVFLGSCFHALNDSEGMVGATYAKLPAGLQPEIKILSGDQVYLDAPWWSFLNPVQTRGSLERRLFSTYRDTWNQAGVSSGFRRLLEAGANYLSSDDHEFWNNATNPASYVPYTWSKKGRDTWYGIALSLFEAFQTTSSKASFDIPPLSFLLVDTRINRRPDRTTFMAGADINAVRDWIKGLQGPGVLVLGQPVLSDKTGFLGRFTDWGLADFAQYDDLVRAIFSSNHSIIVLTGDVHFGRIASCTLKPGVDLVELISSPLALVDKAAKGAWKEAPGRFPAFAIPGVVAVEVRTVDVHKLSDNHFMTLYFTQDGGKVSLTATAWPIVRSGEPPRSKTVWHGLLS